LKSPNFKVENINDYCNDNTKVVKTMSPANQIDIKKVQRVLEYNIENNIDQYKYKFKLTLTCNYFVSTKNVILKHVEIGI